MANIVLATISLAVKGPVTIDGPAAASLVVIELATVQPAVKSAATVGLATAYLATFNAATLVSVTIGSAKPSLAIESTTQLAVCIIFA